MKRLKKFLFEDEPVIGIRKLTDYPYWNILRYCLLFLNAWPGKEIGENPSKYMILINVGLIFMNSSFMCACIRYMILHSQYLSFYDLGQLYITLFMGFVVASRIILTLPRFTKYRDVTAMFITKLHLFYHKDVSDYAMKTYKQVHFISHLFTVYLTWQIVTGCFLFNLIPMWNNYSSGKYKEKILYNSTYEHSIYFSAPFNVHTHLNAYIFANIYNWIITFISTSLYTTLDLLMSLIVFHIWGHLKILIHELESFPLPEKAMISYNERKNTINGEMYSAEEMKQVAKKLTQCINYHRLILDFTKKISHTFGPMLLTDLVFHQVSGCLFLLECSQMTVEALLRYVPFAFIGFQQLIWLSVIFELVDTTSGKLKDAVYSVPWECMDTKNRRTVAIFLMNVQTPIRVKALGVVDVGVTTMATILKTSFSYFIFLHNM